MTKPVRLAGLLCLLSAGLCSAAIPPQFSAKERAQRYRDSVVLAQPRAERTSTIDAAEASEGVTLLRRFPRLRGVRMLRIRARETVDGALARLRATGRYEFVEKDTLRYPRAVPNDPSFPQQWSLRNTGQSGGVAGADIGAITAWDMRNDASSVIVAVMDTGIRLTHADLVSNLWNSSTGTHGINATVSSNSSSYNTPTDTDGHGTHVSGIIGAAGNNGAGIAGVAWRAQLMALKFLGSDGGALSDELACIQYAIDHGAKVINASFGGGGYSGAELTAFAAARDAGIIVVVAAGNDDLNNDIITDYPSGYPLDNIVAVAATTRRDALDTSYSNFGSGSVELGAPGTDVYSTFNDSDTSYTTLSGTSMAAPHVSGAIALLRAKFPAENYRQIINRLLRSVTRLPGLVGKVQTGGRLNLAAALASTSNRPFNDDFADRAVLDGLTVHVRSNNAGATAEAGEPSHASVATANSLWWTWTAPATTNVKIATTGSAYDTVLAVYTGTSVSALQSVASNDNSVGSTSSVSFTAQAGSSYQIAVAGKGGATGYTALTITAPPGNDDFASPKVLTGVGFAEDGTTLNSSSESSEPDPTGQAAGHSVWYKWTAPATHQYNLAAFATQIDTIAAVYTGSSLATLTPVAWNDNSTTTPDNSDALVNFNAAAGTTYYFQIDNNARDGSNGGDFVLTLNDAAWQYPVKDEVTSSPAIGADGTIYFGAGSENGFDRNVYALNPDGTKKWTFTTSTLQSGVGIIGASPAVGADGTVYVGGTDHVLYALDGATGTKKWSATLTSAISSTPAIGADGTIYVRSDTRLYAYSAAGTANWSYAITTSNVGDGGTYASPAVSKEGTVYIGGTEPNSTGIVLYALNGTDGTLKWTYGPIAGEIYSSPAIGADGTIYLATLGGTIYAITDAGSQGVLNWSQTPETPGFPSDISSSLALGTDGTIYYGGYDHRLHALDSGGSEKWSLELGDEVRASSPALAADGTIYIGCYDGLVYAVNPNGTLKRTYATAGSVRSSPVIANNRIYFGSADAKLYAFEIGQPAAATAWPMFHQDQFHRGRASSALSVTSQTVAIGSSVTLTANAAGNLAYQWRFNGVDISGATSATFTRANFQPADAGIYSVRVTGSSTATSMPVVVGPVTTNTVTGAGTLVATNVVHPNGNHYDQVLLTGVSAVVTAQPGRVTRISWIDLNNEIVQAEFAGHGSLTVVLDDATGPALPINYNQPGVSYMKGHARIVIAGADETTNVLVFSVGRLTAFDPSGAFNFLQPISASNNPVNNGSPLFQGHADTNYTGFADIASIAIAPTDGEFGGLRSANADYFAHSGYTGIVAPGVQFVGPVFLYDLGAFDSANPAILLGFAADTRVTGGSLHQPNSQPVQVSGLSQLKFVAGIDSEGRSLPAQANEAQLLQNGTDVTAQVVVNPP